MCVLCCVPFNSDHPVASLISFLVLILSFSIELDFIGGSEHQGPQKEECLLPPLPLKWVQGKCSLTPEHCWFGLDVYRTPYASCALDALYLEGKENLLKSKDVKLREKMMPPHSWL